MISYYYRTIRDTSYQELSEYRKGSIGVIQKATSADLAEIADELHLDVKDLVDVFDAQEIPRLEIDSKYMMLFVRAPLPLENKELMETQLYMLVYLKSRFYVVSHKTADLFLDMLSKGNAATTQTPKLMLQFLLSISKKYSIYINEIARRVEEKRKLFGKITEKDIEQLLTLESILNEYVAVLSPMQKISEALTAKNHLIAWFEEDKDLIEDLMNSLAQSADVCIVNLKKILSLRNSFQIIFTNKLNQTVQFLTSMTIILTIPTMIASLFGMNVSLPLAAGPYGFWLVLAIALAFSFGMGMIFKHNKWI
jgi:magnesium transporter